MKNDDELIHEITNDFYTQIKTVICRSGLVNEKKADTIARAVRMVLREELEDAVNGPTG